MILFHGIFYKGVKGVQLAEKGMESWSKRCWVNIPEI